MANLNDFKYLNFKCRKYFDLLEKDINRTFPKLNDIHKQRYGFYLLMLESICNIKDISDIIEIITDTDFNNVLFSNNYNDFGIDAIYLDEDENVINLFNFKYREKFLDKNQSLNETFLSTKFTNSIINDDTSAFSGKLKTLSEAILNKLNSSEIWKMKLYVISNEPRELDINSPEIKQLKDLYDLETEPIGLDSIINKLSIRPKPINAIIHVDKDSILPFSENSLSSSKSYIIRISANDLIRITCNNPIYRDDYQMEDFKPLSNCQMEFNLLFDNVRGLIIRSKYNKNIYDTLYQNASKFFMYNNGLTITANDIISEDTNANKKVKITITDFQVVNGGQTLRTIHKFNQDNSDNITKYLTNCDILLRIFKTSSSNDTRNKIAEYTNSQNAISNIDLKSLSSEQIQIEQFLDENDIIYARKVGDTGIDEKKVYLHKISMEKLGQIIFSINGNPGKASNQKKQIFDKYYKSIFIDDFDINKVSLFVKRYYEIKKNYEKIKKYTTTDQKIFFILYIDNFLQFNDNKKIDFLEKTINDYKPKNKTVSEARKLLQVKFKEFLDTKIASLK